MYKKLLVPLDGSQSAECVLSHVEDIVRSCEPMPVIFLHVMEPFPGMGSYAGEMLPEDVKRFEDGQAAQGRRYLEDVKARFKAHGSDVVIDLVRGRAPEVICRYAREHGVDLIVMATHGRTGVSKMLLGSVTDQVLTCSEVPVLVVRPGACRPRG